MADSESRTESLLAWLAIALSAFFLYEGAKLKPGVFEPIGPGAVPMGVAVITIILSVTVLVARWRKPFAQAAAEAALDGAAAPQREQWGLLAAVSALTLVYAAVLHSGVVRYGVVTVVYLLATFLVVSGQVRRDLPWAVALALAFGLGLDYVFRHLLVADLP